ncbi:class D beta-lactamase [Amorphus sp. 3PC139-8]|uniref:class D beta-lactamase n=1 Tax=Amorphus sp. 3PC139-8 TaxID=2735676 RepID=UPI00345D5734
MILRAAAVFILVWCGTLSARAADVCTIVADAASGGVVLEEGDCDTRVTPASTFKVALAVMGFDAGVLKGSHDPVLPFKEGYVAWRKEWKQPTDPTSWLKYSVVWYSQQIAHSLGMERFRRYAQAFDYGNADVSGDFGKNNGLDRAWIASSLKIAPREQVTFLQKLVAGRLPVSEQAMALTREIVETRPAGDGWTIHGKTGAAASKTAAGEIVRGRPWGWYVGWASKGDRTYVFAHLIRDESKQSSPPGFRARDAFIAAWPERAERL